MTWTATIAQISRLARGASDEFGWGRLTGQRDELAPPPAELRIVQYDGDFGYFFFGCDESEMEFTDTWREAIERAMSQTEWEFGVRPDEWESAEA